MEYTGRNFYSFRKIMKMIMAKSGMTMRLGLHEMTGHNHILCVVQNFINLIFPAINSVLNKRVNCSSKIELSYFQLCFTDTFM